MSEIIPTVMVKFKEGGFVAHINQADFNETLHERLDGNVAAAATTTTAATMTVAQIKARLEELKVTFDEKAKKPELEALLAAALSLNETPPAPVLTVQAKDEKFIIVDAAGVQQGAEFDTEQAAKDMVLMMGGAA